MRKIIGVVVFILMIFVMSYSNFAGYDLIDTNYHFNKAIIRMPDDSVVVVDILTWADAEGEQLTITSTDGTRYLVSSYNCVLVEQECERDPLGEAAGGMR